MYNHCDSLAISCSSHEVTEVPKVSVNDYHKSKSKYSLGSALAKNDNRMGFVASGVVDFYKESKEKKKTSKEKRSREMKTTNRKF